MSNIAQLRISTFGRTAAPAQTQMEVEDSGKGNDGKDTSPTKRKPTSRKKGKGSGGGKNSSSGGGVMDMTPMMIPRRTTSPQAHLVMMIAMRSSAKA